MTGRLLTGFGLTPSLLVLPFTLLGGTISLLLWPGLFTATGTRLAEASLRTSVNDSGLEILYLPIPDSIKKKVKVFLDVTVERLGDGTRQPPVVHDRPLRPDDGAAGRRDRHVKPVYMPVMALSGKVLDSVISKAEIMKEQHFRVMLPECDYAVRFALTDCKIKFSNGRSYNVPQGVIGWSIKKEVNRLKPGSKVCFENIRILEFTGKERTLDNACYTLIE